MKLETRVLSSLHRVFPASCPDEYRESFSGFRNEPISFQIAYRSADETVGNFYIKTSGELPVSCYRVGCVPVTHIKKNFCDEPLTPGLFPDMLLPYDLTPQPENFGMCWANYYYTGTQHQFFADDAAWQSIWFTVNEKETILPAGDYTVTVSLYNVADNKKITECHIPIHIAAAEMPEQKLLYTNWFHCDCLCDAYRVRPFSERFWKLFEAYAKAAADHGMNMILLPAFTPPLDTPIGHYRRRMQLVGVEKQGDTYRFDFSQMKRFMETAERAGIRAYEHSHLFTQWGAEAAPAVYAKVNGQNKRIFGWDTPAASPDYVSFLRQYFEALGDFLKENPKTVYFHISDEPGEHQIEAYSAAMKIVRDALGEDVRIFDALSDPAYYEKGILKTPVAVTTNVHKFKGCDDLWAYYTGGQSTAGLSTRVLYAAPPRNRAIGYQLYQADIKGFLHWGYNFWYDRPSIGLFDPKTDACGYAGNAGTSYCVYPGEEGPILSMRQKVFYEGLCDERVLRYAETVLGRDTCLALIHKYFGDGGFYSAKADYSILAFRRELHQMIEGEK